MNKSFQIDYNPKNEKYEVVEYTIMGDGYSQGYVLAAFKSYTQAEAYTRGV